MTSDQNQALQAPWGLGWALGRSKVWNAFGDTVFAFYFWARWSDRHGCMGRPAHAAVCVVLRTGHIRSTRAARVKHFETPGMGIY